VARTVTGVDIGLRTNEFLRGAWKGNTFHVSDFAVVEHRSRNVVEAWSSGSPGFKPQAARVGLTGRDVNIRYTRVPRVPDWQLRKLMRFEVEEIGGQSGSAVASDFNVLPSLPEIEGEDVVLLAMARESFLEEHARGVAQMGGRIDAFTPCALALYAAWTHFGAIEEETVLIANIGHENLDVVLVRGPDLLFARNLSGGSRLFDEAIAERFGVSPQKAEQLKVEMATLEPGVRYENANQEKASRACLGAAGQLLSLLQSTVLFCKSQVKVSSLRVDRVLLCGGGAALEGLPRYLSAGMGVPVELFDPFRVVDVSALRPEAAEQLEQFKLESVVALGLATMASDPDAYSVEILPAATRRRREFLAGPAFLVAAAVLAVLFLAYEGWRTSSSLSEVRARTATLDAQLRRATTTHRRAAELARENAELQEAASLLAGVAGAGEQLVRSLEHLERRLPGDFWIDELSSDWRADEGLGIKRGSERPILRVEGLAREGTESVAAQLEALRSGLEQALPGARRQLTQNPRGDRFTLQLTHFGPPTPPPPAPGDAPGDASRPPGGASEAREGGS
jgi:Tfp pilus assembly PilM family ATPase/Tfp pilus assembly protein PilN